MTDGDILEIQELILEIMYKGPQFRYTEKALEELIAVTLQDKPGKTLDVDKFTQALKDLVDNEFVECYEMAVPPGKTMTLEGERPQIFTDKKKMFYKLTRDGFNKALKNKEDELKNLTFKKFRDKWAEVISQTDVQRREIEQQAEKVSELEEKFENTYSEVKKIRDGVEQTKGDVTKIKNEVDTIRKEFYGRILQIFGIFVSIFAFIIVGFTQITTLVDPGSDWLTNFSNTFAVFIPLLIVLLVLMGVTAWIVKCTSK